MVPFPDAGKHQRPGPIESIRFLQRQLTVEDRTVLGVTQEKVDLGHGGLDKFQPQPQGARLVICVQPRIQPQVLYIALGFGIEIDAAENAAEAEEILILQPGCAAALVDLYAQPVAGGMNIGGQIKFRGGEAVLTVAHKVTVEPHIHGLLHALKADAHRVLQKGFLQVKTGDIAAYGIVPPVDVRRPEFRVAVPVVELVDVLDLIVALGLHVAGNLDGVKVGVVKIRLPEVGGAAFRVFAPAEAPEPVQGLPQGGFSCGQLLDIQVGHMVRVGIQSVYAEYGGVFQPGKGGFHRKYLLILSFSALLP